MYWSLIILNSCSYLILWFSKSFFSLPLFSLSSLNLFLSSSMSSLCFFSTLLSSSACVFLMSSISASCLSLKSSSSLSTVGFGASKCLTLSNLLLIMIFSSSVFASDMILAVLLRGISWSLSASLSLSLVISLCTKYFEKASLLAICVFRSDALRRICSKSFGLASSIIFLRSPLMLERPTSNCFCWSRANLHFISGCWLDA